MHQLVRVIVPPETLFPDCNTFEHEDLPYEKLTYPADTAKCFAIEWVQLKICIEPGGYADWCEKHAGQFSDRLHDRYGDDNLAPLLTDEDDDNPNHIILIGEPAMQACENAWESTVSSYENAVETVREKLEEHAIEPSALLERDVMRIRDLSFLDHLITRAYGEAPSPLCNLYIAEPYHRPVDTPSAYEKAKEIIQNGGIVVHFDVHI